MPCKIAEDRFWAQSQGTFSTYSRQYTWTRKVTASIMDLKSSKVEPQVQSTWKCEKKQHYFDELRWQAKTFCKIVKRAYFQAYSVRHLQYKWHLKLLKWSNLCIDTQIIDLQAAYHIKYWCLKISSKNLLKRYLNC